MAGAIGALGASWPFDDLSLDGGGLAQERRSQPVALAAIYLVLRGAGTKQTAAFNIQVRLIIAIRRDY